MSGWLPDGVTEWAGRPVARSGVLLLRWLGRREVPGVVEGAGLSVDGTVSSSADGLAMILNPLYRFGDPRPPADRG